MYQLQKSIKPGLQTPYFAVKHTLLLEPFIMDNELDVAVAAIVNKASFNSSLEMAHYLLLVVARKKSFALSQVALASTYLHKGPEIWSTILPSSHSANSILELGNCLARDMQFRPRRAHHGVTKNLMSSSVTRVCETSKFYQLVALERLG